MYAIVDIAGQQFKVEKDKKIFVHRLKAEQGQQIEFNKVLMVGDDGKDMKLGEPHVSGALVVGKVLGHVRGDKVLVFKKKRRKGYQKLNGHRQDFTELLIENIVSETSKKETAKKAKAEPTEEKEVAVEATANVVVPEAKTPKAASKPKAKKETSEKEDNSEPNSEA